MITKSIKITITADTEVVAESKKNSIVKIVTGLIKGNGKSKGMDTKTLAKLADVIQNQPSKVAKALKFL